MTISKRRNRPTEAEIKPNPVQAVPDFENLFQDNWERVCAVVFRLVGDWGEAEDIALETFLRLYLNPPRHDQNLGGWLYRVASRLGLNAIRARKRRREHEERAGKQILEQENAWNPADSLETRQARENVRKALAQMKPRSAQILALRYSGLSYAEIAEALGLSLGSVGTFLARAEKEFEQQYRRLEGG